jgi:hypothetical protein
VRCGPVDGAQPGLWTPVRHQSLGILTKFFVTSQQTRHSSTDVYWSSIVDN